MAVQTTPLGVPCSAPWWVLAVAVVSALLSAAGAIIALIHPAMLVGPRAEINESARIFAGYFVARNLTLAGALVLLLVLRARRALGQLLALVGFIQLLDAAIDGLEGRWAVAPGVLVLGVLFLVAARRLTGVPLWSRSAWSD